MFKTTFKKMDEHKYVGYFELFKEMDEHKYVGFFELYKYAG